MKAGAGASQTPDQELHQRLLNETETLPPHQKRQLVGVGPIPDPEQSEWKRIFRDTYEFNQWCQEKFKCTASELQRSMHRGDPGEPAIKELLKTVHEYFEFGEDCWLGLGLGGGHGAFSMLTGALLNNDSKIYIDTPKPGSGDAKAAGAFRQSWAGQVGERCDSDNMQFGKEGQIPSAAELEEMGVNTVIAVGNETTGGTTMGEQDARNLLEWIKKDLANRHAIVDGTSLLGAISWPDDLRKEFMAKANIFTPPQKAIGGRPMMSIVSLTPHARALANRNAADPMYPIHREYNLAPNGLVANGPFYNPKTDKMQGGVINTVGIYEAAYSAFLLQRQAKKMNVEGLNERSAANLSAVEGWTAEHPLFKMAVADETRRSSSVMLLKVNDPDLTPAEKTKVIADTKALLWREGITHPNGYHEKGLEAVKYLNAFPGTDGDFRAWIGGVSEKHQVKQMLDMIEYAYKRAKVVAIEKRLAEHSIEIPVPENSDVRKEVAGFKEKAHKVLITDPIGTRLLPDGETDIHVTREYIEEQGGVFHEGAPKDDETYKTGKIHYFYQPTITPEEIEAQSSKYDGVIVAAKVVKGKFKAAARMGAGVGNMQGEFGALTNTPGQNSRAAAQAAWQALIQIAGTTHDSAAIDTETQLGITTKDALDRYRIESLQGKTLALLGAGNISCEAIKIAKAYDMKIKVFAREEHRKSIEAWGCEFAGTAAEAADDADFLMPFMGESPETRGIINAGVLAELNDGASVVNFDRAALVDVGALDTAMASGKVHSFAGDFDKFAEGVSPIDPFMPLAKKYESRVLLSPHIAVDSELTSRHGAAQQAVKQMQMALQYEQSPNIVRENGEFKDMGADTPIGVGVVTPEKVAAISQAQMDGFAMVAAKVSAMTMAAAAGHLSQAEQAEMVKTLTQFTNTANKLGLAGIPKGFAGREETPAAANGHAAAVSGGDRKREVT